MMVTLDFRECKSRSDVKKVFDKNKKELTLFEVKKMNEGYEALLDNWWNKLSKHEKQDIYNSTLIHEL